MDSIRFVTPATISVSNPGAKKPMTTSIVAIAASHHAAIGLR